MHRSTTESRSLLANFAWMSAGDTASRIVLFATTIYLGITLGREGFGRISFAQAVVVYFFWVSHMGLPQVATRMISRDRSRVEELATRVRGGGATLSYTLSTSTETLSVEANARGHLRIRRAAKEQSAVTPLDLVQA